MIICSIAFGDEHIREYNALIDHVLNINKDLKFIVTTDNPEKIDHRSYRIIPYYDPFNYNLKRISIEEALKETDTIFYLDTDVIVSKEIDFSIVSDLPKNTFYINHLFDMSEQKKDGSMDYIKEYLMTIDENYQNLKLVGEAVFLLKCDKTVGDRFIRAWEKLDTETRICQPVKNGNQGVMEGFIIWSAIIESGLDHHDINSESVVRKLFKNIIHLEQDGNKFNRTII